MCLRLFFECFCGPDFDSLLDDIEFYLRNKKDDELIILFDELLENKIMTLNTATEIIYRLALTFPTNKEFGYAALTLLLKAAQEHSESENIYFVRHAQLLINSNNEDTKHFGFYILANLKNQNLIHKSNCEKFKKPHHLNNDLVRLRKHLAQVGFSPRAFCN